MSRETILKNIIGYYKIVFSISVIFILTACIVPPDEIEPASISDTEYRNYNCKDIITETAYVKKEISSTYEILKEKYNYLGGTAEAIGSVMLYPPGIIFVNDYNDTAEKYSNLKAKLEGLEKLSIKNKCVKTDM